MDFLWESSALSPSAGIVVNSYKTPSISCGELKNLPNFTKLSSFLMMEPDVFIVTPNAWGHVCGTAVRTRCVMNIYVTTCLRTKYKEPFSLVVRNSRWARSEQ